MTRGSSITMTRGPLNISGLLSRVCDTCYHELLAPGAWNQDQTRHHQTMPDGNKDRQVMTQKARESPDEEIGEAADETSQEVKTAALAPVNDSEAGSDDSEGEINPISDICDKIESC